MSVDMVLFQPINHSAIKIISLINHIILNNINVRMSSSAELLKQDI